eukprot:14116410-Ditylum_brightwellii.AAC.2
MPLAPVDTKCIIYKDPKTRGTWDVHGRDAFYLGPALEHYHCYKHMQKCRQYLHKILLHMWPNNSAMHYNTPIRQHRITNLDQSKYKHYNN